MIPASARKLIARGGNSVVVSAASAWEIATKVRLGKQPMAMELAEDFDRVLVQEGFEGLRFPWITPSRVTTWAAQGSV